MYVSRYRFEDTLEQLDRKNDELRTREREVASLHLRINELYDRIDSLQQSEEVCALISIVVPLSCIIPLAILSQRFYAYCVRLYLFRRRCSRS